MTASVHPTALVDPSAELGDGTVVGPFAIIGPDVVTGPGCRIDARASLERYVRLGAGVQVGVGTILGGPPQDLKFRSGTVSYLEIGEDTTIRECVTANVATDHGSTTHIGARCLLMAYSHVGHNTVVGDEVVIANGAQLAGHVEVQDYAIIGGLVPIHQFCRVGRYSFVGGGCRIGKDVPPFLRAAGEPLRPSSLNSIGLTRRGFSEEVVAALKRAFRILYRQDLLTEEALRRIRAEVPDLPEVREFANFVESSARGIIR